MVEHLSEIGSDDEAEIQGVRNEEGFDLSDAESLQWTFYYFWNRVIRQRWSRGRSDHH